jgi:hypothetical protein
MGEQYSEIRTILIRAKNKGPKIYVLFSYFLIDSRMILEHP